MPTKTIMFLCVRFGVPPENSGEKQFPKLFPEEIERHDQSALCIDPTIMVGFCQVQVAMLPPFFNF